MKYTKYSAYLLAFLLLAGACDQEVMDLQEPEPAPDPCTGTAGSVDFTKFVAVGNSYVAGFQAGALFTDGQNNSLAAILNKQFECVGAPSTFNQPTINATLGWNLFVPQPILGPPFDPTKPIYGRMLLQGASPKPTPQKYNVGDFEALPNPQANPGFMYGGSKTELNNFSVPAIVLGQAMTPATGGPPPPAANPAFTPFYMRFASSPSPDGATGSSIMSDAKAAGGTFFLFWLGLDDFFLHAAFGADPSKAPLTSTAAFSAQYDAALFLASPHTGLLTADPDSKAVIGNFPNIFAMPHFTAVPYNPIPLDADKSGQLNAGFAGYNAAIDGLKNPAFGGAFGTAAELDARKVSFVVGANKILLADESILDLGGGFDQLQAVGAITPTQRAQLAPFEQVRQSTPTDVVPLATGSVLGVPGTFGILGLSEPVGDQYIIVPAEKAEINAARLAFNEKIAAVATANPTRIALADVDAAFNALLTNPLTVSEGILITPNINPPTGIFSEDGVHPNSRGYAFLSNVFIKAINAKFGSTIPLTQIGKYKATALPIP